MELTCKSIEVNGWTLKGVGFSESNIEAISTILSRSYFNAQMLRKAIPCLIPITIDSEAHLICFWQVIGVTFFSCSLSIEFPRTNLYLPESSLSLFEHELHRKNASDEELALRLKKVFCCDKEIWVNQDLNYVYFY